MSLYLFSFIAFLSSSALLSSSVCFAEDVIATIEGKQYHCDTVINANTNSKKISTHWCGIPGFEKDVFLVRKSGAYQVYAWKVKNENQDPISITSLDGKSVENEMANPGRWILHDHWALKDLDRIGNDLIKGGEEHKNNALFETGGKIRQLVQNYSLKLKEKVKNSTKIKFYLSGQDKPIDCEKKVSHCPILSCGKVTHDGAVHDAMILNAEVDCQLSLLFLGEDQTSRNLGKTKIEQVKIETDGKEEELCRSISGVRIKQTKMLNKVIKQLQTERKDEMFTSQEDDCQKLFNTAQKQISFLEDEDAKDQFRNNIGGVLTELNRRGLMGDLTAGGRRMCMPYYPKGRFTDNNLTEPPSTSSSESMKPVVSLNEAQEMFDRLRNLAEIPHGWTEAYCNDRAHIGCNYVSRNGFECEKIWIKAPSLRSTSSRPDWWPYHVAPVIRVGDSISNSQYMVLDVSLGKGPMTVDEWKAKMRYNGDPKWIETNRPEDIPQGYNSPYITITPRTYLLKKSNASDPYFEKLTTDEDLRASLKESMNELKNAREKYDKSNAGRFNTLKRTLEKYNRLKEEQLDKKPRLTQ